MECPSQDHVNYHVVARGILANVSSAIAMARRGDADGGRYVSDAVEQRASRALDARVDAGEFTAIDQIWSAASEEVCKALQSGCSGEPRAEERAA